MNGAEPSTDFVKELLVPTQPDDERMWVPQATNIWFRPILFSVANGYWVNLLKVRKSGVLNRHLHPSPVFGYVIKGSWRYLEHDWVATEGSFVFEPPGEIHTLVVDSDVDEMITLFHVQGVLIYMDENDRQIAYEDVHTKLRKARDHFQAIGLGAAFADQFIR